MNKFVFGIVGTVVIFAFGGCGDLDEPEMSPEEVVQEAMAKNAEVESYTSVMEFEEKIIGSAGGVEVNGDIVVASDRSNKNIPKMSMEIGANAEVPGKNFSLDAGIRIIGDSFFFRLSELDGLPEANLFIGQYTGKWWELTGLDVVKQLSGGFSLIGFDPGIQEKVQELMKEISLFSDLEYEGSGKAAGVESYHYSGKLDSNGVIELLQKLAEINEKPMTLENKDSMRAALENMDIYLDIWISPDDFLIRRMDYNIEGSMPDREEVNLILNLSGEFFDFNEEVEIERPAGAETFDLNELLEPLFALDKMQNQ